MRETISALDEKTHIYELFANLFAKEPTAELLQLFRTEGYKKLFGAYEIDFLSDLKHMAAEQQVETLSVEYTRLFITPAKSTSPRGSLQLGEERLWGKSTVEVNEIYKKFGFELDDDFKDTPDHLSAELTFLAELSKLELEYENGGLKKAKAGVLKVKKYFLKSHLLKWFPRFKEKIAKHAKFVYYRNIARLLDSVLNDELENLKYIKEVTNV